MKKSEQLVLNLNDLPIKSVTWEPLVGEGFIFKDDHKYLQNHLGIFKLTLGDTFNVKMANEDSGWEKEVEFKVDWIFDSSVSFHGKTIRATIVQIKNYGAV